MEKTIKILLLTNNQVLISQIDEVAAIDIGQPDCKLTNPYVVTKDSTLEPWLINISRQDVFMISSDKILTITEPMPTLLEKYEELIK
jgi:hypothetical protein|tara:strand:+ start:381 stop:641 length:261 start_codon:yes stop_codon:yes gene_type:complete